MLVLVKVKESKEFHLIEKRGVWRFAYLRDN